MLGVQGVKPRVLLIAEAANPEWTSVPLIGWEMARVLQTVADIHLVTQLRNREAILRQGWIEGRQFTAIDNEAFLRPLLKIGSLLRGGPQQAWTTLSALSAFAYYSFEAELWRQFRHRLERHEFDLVHRVTPLSPTCQSTLAAKLAKRNIPFVIGPLNGGVPWPTNFRHRQVAEREWLSNLRPFYKLLPAYRSTRKTSSAILVGSQFTKRDMPVSVQGKCVYIPENGVNLELFKRRRSTPARLPLRGSFVGRLVPYKGADMLIRAAEPFLRSGQMYLDIIGDGPQRGELERLISHTKLEKFVRCHGWVSHARLQDILSTCDFLGFPSIREFGGGVVLEAMSLGLTPIVANYGGPAELVKDHCGIRVPFHDEGSLIEGFRRTFAAVVESPEILDRLGSAAIAEIDQKYSWERKASQVLKVYKAVLDGIFELEYLGI
jgi:glycosyltransferase involved in cell wall biosynthesis